MRELILCVDPAVVASLLLVHGNDLLALDIAKNDKPKRVVLCRYGKDCHAFKSIVQGGERLKDRCHIRIYRHMKRTNAGKRYLAGCFP